MTSKTEKSWSVENKFSKYFLLKTAVSPYFFLVNLLFSPKKHSPLNIKWSFHNLSLNQAVV